MLHAVLGKTEAEHTEDYKAQRSRADKDRKKTVVGVVVMQVVFHRSVTAGLAVIDDIAEAYSGDGRKLEQLDAFVPHLETSAVEVFVFVFKGNDLLFPGRSFLAKLFDNGVVIKNDMMFCV